MLHTHTLVVGNRTAETIKYADWSLFLLWRSMVVVVPDKSTDCHLNRKNSTVRYAHSMWPAVNWFKFAVKMAILRSHLHI